MATNEIEILLDGLELDADVKAVVVRAFQAGQAAGVEALRKAGTVQQAAPVGDWKSQVEIAKKANDQKAVRQLLDARWNEINKMRAREQAAQILKDAGVENA